MTWFLLALGASLSAALGMYMHQRLNGSNFASGIWLKILAVLAAAPVLLQTGLPENPLFYPLAILAALIWCVNDIIYFKGVTTHGAALLSRLSPLGILLVFILWLLIKPDLLQKYLDEPFRFMMICATLIFAALCAGSLKRCAVSWSALKSIWFVIFASVAGSVVVKAAVDLAPDEQGVFGYVGIEAFTMLCCYGVILSIWKRDAIQDVFSFCGMKTGGIVGAFLLSAIVLRIYAYKNADNPAFVNMIAMLDVLWLIILTRLSGWKDESNKLAGLGIVAAALALAFLKIR
ncbi:MAG TPA: hypothetical protein VIF12_04130 [Micavibrio sp.]